MFRSKPVAIALAVAVLAYAGSHAAAHYKWTSKLSAENDVIWAKKIAEGGYILHFRHAQREKWNDVTAFDAIELIKGYKPEEVPFPRATCLTEQGRQEAQLIKDVFEASNVKTDQVVSSPSCRSQMTAKIAFGSDYTISNSLLHRTAIADRQHDAFAKELRTVVLGMKPAAGKNAVLSGHGGTLRFDGAKVVDKNETGEGLDDRDETGFVVLENVGGKIIARYKFPSLHIFAHAAIELPLTRPTDQISQVAK